MKKTHYNAVTEKRMEQRAKQLLEKYSPEKLADMLAEEQILQRNRYNNETYDKLLDKVTILHEEVMEEINNDLAVMLNNAGVKPYSLRIQYLAIDCDRCSLKNSSMKWAMGLQDGLYGEDDDPCTPERMKNCPLAHCFKSISCFIPSIEIARKTVTAILADGSQKIKVSGIVEVKIEETGEVLYSRKMTALEKKAVDTERKEME